MKYIMYIYIDIIILYTYIYIYQEHPFLHPSFPSLEYLEHLEVLAWVRAKKRLLFPKDHDIARFDMT